MNPDDFDLPDTPIGMSEWLESDVDITDYADVFEFKDTILDDILKRQAQRREYAVRGAWMAGYQYLHVFEPRSFINGEPQEVVHPDLVFLPRDTPKHPREFGGKVYSCTYDFSKVPDHVIKDAIDESRRKSP